MKYVKLVYLFLITSTALYAQSTKESIALKGIKWVKIKTKSSIIVKSNAADSLLIALDPTMKIPEKAEGLTLFSSKKANTNVGFYMEKKGEILFLENIRNDGRGSAVIYMPAHMNVTVEEVGLDDVTVEDMKGEVEVISKVMGGISITNVVGPVTANTATGDITVIFTKVNQASPITISSLSGDLDVSVPKKTAANVEISSSMGDLYTNIDLAITNTKEASERNAGVNVKAKMNTGGVLINLHSGTGNVFFRQR